MPIKYDTEQLLHKWIDTGNKGQVNACGGSVYLNILGLNEGCQFTYAV